MFLKVEDNSCEIKDGHFTGNILINAIMEEEGPSNVVQVGMHNALVCRAMNLNVDSRYNHIF